MDKNVHVHPLNLYTYDAANMLPPVLPNDEEKVDIGCVVLVPNAAVEPPPNVDPAAPPKLKPVVVVLLLVVPPPKPNPVLVAGLLPAAAPKLNPPAVGVVDR